MVKGTVLERLQLSKKKIIREGGKGGGGTEKGLGKDGQTEESAKGTGQEGDEIF